MEHIHSWFLIHFLDTFSPILQQYHLILICIKSFARTYDLELYKFIIYRLCFLSVAIMKAFPLACGTKGAAVAAGRGRACSADPFRISLSFAKKNPDDIRTYSVLPYAIQAVASLDCIGEAQRHTHKVWSLHCEGKVTKCDNRQSSGFASLLWAATFGASPAVEALQWLATRIFDSQVFFIRLMSSECQATCACAEMNGRSAALLSVQ